MAINLSNYINGTSNYNQQIQSGNQAPLQTGVTGTASGAVNSTGQTSAGNLMLQNMLAGDTFTGQVLSVKDNQVSLMLSNGASLMAVLSDHVQIQSGQTVTFIVEENQDQRISIKPMAVNEQQAYMINKALEGAGLPLTKDNISIVKELLSLNMPVNADTINQMIHEATAFPDTDYHTIANLLRLEIPVTSKNIMQFQAYSHFENNLSQSLRNIEDGIFHQLVQVFDGQSGTENGLNMMNELIQSMYDNNGAEIKSMPMSELFNEAQLSALTNELSELIHGTQNPNQAESGSVMEQLLSQLKDGMLTSKDFVTHLLNANEMKLQNPKGFQEIIHGDALKTALHQMMNETMKLTPDAVRAQNAIPEYYERVRKKLEIADRIIEENGGNPEIQKELNNVKANIDFMNDLNKNMTFFQMPIKFSESEGNGELYVFTNKKAMKHQTDDISALLHLDMENLGSMDVYVKLSNKNVSTNFCLESEEMLDFIYSHVDELDARLSALGYATHFEMNVSKKETNSFDFVEDFIEHDVHKIITEQYVFDSKV